MQYYVIRDRPHGGSSLQPRECPELESGRPLQYWKVQVNLTVSPLLPSSSLPSFSFPFPDMLSGYLSSLFLNNVHSQGDQITLCEFGFQVH